MPAPPDRLEGAEAGLEQRKDLDREPLLRLQFTLPVLMPHVNLRAYEAAALWLAHGVQARLS